MLCELMWRGCSRGGGALVFEVGYHPRKKNHVIGVVFQDQAMYARASIRGAKTVCFWSYQGFWIYLYFRIRHSFAQVWTILNKMTSFGVNIYRPSASEHGQNITNITMI